MNLYNFLILFSLCKLDPRLFPKSQSDWFRHTKNSALKVGPYVLTADEIDHAMLRAQMCVPKIPNLPHDSCPKFDKSDPRSRLVFKKKDKYINFALYFPTKYTHACKNVIRSCPPLRIYTPEKVMSQMRENAKLVVVRSAKLYPSKSYVLLPIMFQWYGPDFLTNGEREDLFYFLISYLPKDPAECLKQMVLSK